MIDHHNYEPICTQQTVMVLPDLEAVIGGVAATELQLPSHDDLRIGLVYTELGDEPPMAKLVAIDVASVNDDDESGQIVRVLINPHQARSIAENLLYAIERINGA